MLKFSGLADLISCYKRCDDRSPAQEASQVGTAAKWHEGLFVSYLCHTWGVNALHVPNTRAIWHTAAHCRRPGLLLEHTLQV